jgi:anti-sigma factor RsiW
MDYKAQLKLQAYLDGELSDAEARSVADSLANDKEAAALLAELRQTHEAVAGFENEIRLPESREFFWSKIERQIERSSPVVEPVRDVPIPLIARLRRLLVPMAGVALLVIAGLLVFPTPPRDDLNPRSDQPMETALADAGSMIYKDDSAKATFVFLSYPADDEGGDGDEMAQPD